MYNPLLFVILISGFESFYSEAGTGEESEQFHRVEGKRKARVSSSTVTILFFAEPQ